MRGNTQMMKTHVRANTHTHTPCGVILSERRSYTRDEHTRTHAHPSLSHHTHTHTHTHTLENEVPRVSTKRFHGVGNISV